MEKQVIKKTTPFIGDRKPSEEEMKAAITTIIKGIGDDPNREGVLETPDRVVRSYKELFAGYEQNPADILAKKFSNDGGSRMVVLKEIEFYSTCEHHMIPFTGKVHIGYFPTKEIVGLSKLARLVECFARRLQIQENLVSQIADAIETELAAKGVAVVVEAKHFCMCSRGVNKQDSVMVTSAMRGHFLKAEPRAEFLALIR